MLRYPGPHCLKSWQTHAWVMSHMRAIVERESTPAIRGIQRLQSKDLVRGVGDVERIETAIMAADTIDDVPWRRRVVLVVRLDLHAPGHGLTITEYSV